METLTSYEKAMTRVAINESIQMRDKVLQSTTDHSTRKEIRRQIDAMEKAFDKLLH